MAQDYHGQAGNSSLSLQAIWRFFGCELRALKFDLIEFLV